MPHAHTAYGRGCEILIHYGDYADADDAISRPLAVSRCFQTTSTSKATCQY